MKFSKDRNRTVKSVLHEIGHICEADHCSEKMCLMYPYYVPSPIDGRVMADLLCPSCKRIISESWVYRRLLKTETEKKGTDDGAQVQRIEPTKKMRNGFQSTIANGTFPNWSLPKNDFIRQVKEYFGYE